MTKSASMSAEFNAKQQEMMGDQDKKKAIEEHFKNDIWPNKNTNGFMNRDQYYGMIEEKDKYADQTLGDHIPWSKEEMDAQYDTYCEIFEADKEKGLSLENFENMKPLFKAAIAAGMAAQ